MEIQSDRAIVADALTCDFGAVRAVDHLTLEVPAGTIFGFLGPNGAGKTTTIHLLLGLLEPSAGRAEVLGFDTRQHGQEIRARTGALLEHHGLYEQLTAEENLEFYGRIWHLSASESAERSKQLLSELGLWERRTDRVGRWSRGMKQKLALARALLHRPELVFLDEPTAGLDVEAATTLRNELTALVEESGITVFLTTHNMAEAEQLCGQIAVVRKGGLAAVGSPDELRTGRENVLEITGSGFTKEFVPQLRSQPAVLELEV